MIPPIAIRFFIEEKDGKRFITNETVQTKTKEEYDKVVEENEKLRKSIVKLDFSFLESEEFKEKDRLYKQNYHSKGHSC